MNDNDDRAVENPGPATYAENTGARLARLESRVTVVEVDVAVIRSSFATREDLHNVHRELLGSIQRLELLVREQHTVILDAIHKQREETLNAIHKQREETLQVVHEQRADMLKFMVMQAWRLYAFGAALVGATYFIARNVA